MTSDDKCSVLEKLIRNPGKLFAGDVIKVICPVTNKKETIYIEEGSKCKCLTCQKELKIEFDI